MRCRRVGVARRISGLLTGWQGLPQKTSTFSGSSCPRVTKDHGPQGHPFHQGPVMMRWPVLLPLVWQRGHQNEGTVVNHLQSTHYHLGLICSCCLDYFTTSAEDHVLPQCPCLQTQLTASAMMMMTGMKRTMSMMTMVTKMSFMFEED